MSDVIDFFERRNERLRANSQSIDLEHFTLMVEEITKLLKSMPGKKETTVKVMYADMIAGYSKEQLINSVNMSTSNLWEKKPMFYSALIDELLRQEIVPREGK